MHCYMKWNIPKHCEFIAFFITCKQHFNETNIHVGILIRNKMKKKGIQLVKEEMLSSFISCNIR